MCLLPCFTHTHPLPYMPSQGGEEALRRRWRDLEDLDRTQAGRGGCSLWETLTAHTLGIHPPMACNTENHFLSHVHLLHDPVMGQGLQLGREAAPTTLHLGNMETWARLGAPGKKAMEEHFVSLIPSDGAWQAGRAGKKTVPFGILPGGTSPLLPAPCPCRTHCQAPSPTIQHTSFLGHLHASCLPKH